MMARCKLMAASLSWGWGRTGARRDLKPRHLPVKGGAINAQEFSGFSFIVLGESQNINQDLSLGLEKDLWISQGPPLFLRGRGSQMKGEILNPDDITFIRASVRSKTLFSSLTLPGQL